ncbi:chemotaxis protein CheA [Hyphomicrobium facile]|uniref:Chemotaxis protein CheA n=1 Tax=Hyphomicrobium facile TaxID=51670 RepID=A0A1I7NR70_9HYPH|nr:chemotaxis protein CheA [Hyphomicrobium facile]SFV37187.1 two-component system, chemotaxis family, sensor kinase CheA [Hyphomicrobium facile]
MTVDTMAAIRQTFFQECEEQLSEMELGLLSMDEGNTDSETVNAVFRAVHSIKGGAGAFKLTALVQFAHTFETALDYVRSGKLHPSADVMKAMLRAADVLADLVAASRDGKEIDESSYAGVAADVKALTTVEGEEEVEEVIEFQPTVIDFGLPDMAPEPTAAPVHEYRVGFTPRPELYLNGNETVLIVRELSRLGNAEVSCDASAVPGLDTIDPNGAYLSWNIKLSSEAPIEAVREVFEFVDGEAEISIEADGQSEVSDAAIAALLAQALGNASAGEPETAVTETNSEDHPQSAPAPTEVIASETAAVSPQATEAKAVAVQTQTTIRVEFDRVDRLINLVGELVINQAMLSQRVIEANFAGSSSVIIGLEELEQLTREIQESVMAIRAQPVKPLFQRMSRIVRELADTTGKQVRLKTDGEATEVDKTVVERLAEPLTHMIRNAVDHGIESPEERIAAGKSPEGNVRLSAAHRSGRIVIEISDDGAGINRPKVRASAIKKGLISPDAQLSDSDIDNLLFLPGFSTAATISNISGRGVGMDVVKRSILALGGRISISSRPGQGSTFSMSLPLTLAVLDGMAVSVAGQTLVVPLTAIVETLKPKKGEIHGIGADSRVMAIRNTFVPLIDVGTQMGFRDTPADPERSVAILVETGGGARNALLVDSIQDQRQVVIKSLEANYGTVAGIAAATILGDGRVALILDVDALVSGSLEEQIGGDVHYGTGG